MNIVKTFRLVHNTARNLAAQYAMTAPDGWIAKFSEPLKSRDKECHYHAMISDIAAQCEFLGQKWSEEDWKRLLVDAYVQVARENARAEGKPDPFSNQGRCAPSLDGKRIVQLGIQTRFFTEKQAREFVEYLYAFGAERSVKWKDA